MRTVSATQLARNTREVLDAVAVQRETVEITRNDLVVARISPVEIATDSTEPSQSQSAFSLALGRMERARKA